MVPTAKNHILTPITRVRSVDEAPISIDHPPWDVASMLCPRNRSTAPAPNALIGICGGESSNSQHPAMMNGTDAIIQGRRRPIGVAT